MFYFNFDLYVFLAVFVSGLLVFVFMKNHLLITLLSLEYLVVSIYMFFVYFLSMFIGDMYIILMFLCFSVCEGVLGLSILVSIIRCHGNDQVCSLSFIKW